MLIPHGKRDFFIKISIRIFYSDLFPVSPFKLGNASMYNFELQLIEVYNFDHQTNIYRTKSFKGSSVQNGTYSSEV